MIKRTPWFAADTHPVHYGWYERDHRNVTTYKNPLDRRICLDLWMPVRDPRDILYPGVWYVRDDSRCVVYTVTGKAMWMTNDSGINDASRQHLPWRGLTRLVK